jgi:predicted nucleic acid-binding protein
VIVVDSSVWISFFAQFSTPQVETLLSIRDRTRIVVGDLIMVEVLRGAQSERAAREIEKDLRRFDVAKMVDADIATKAAHNYRLLRSKGLTIRSSVDLIVGTYCIEHGHHLLHRDRDFDHMRQLGLQVYTG